MDWKALGSRAALDVATVGGAEAARVGAGQKTLKTLGVGGFLGDTTAAAEKGASQVGQGNVAGGLNTIAAPWKAAAGGAAKGIMAAGNMNVVAPPQVVSPTMPGGSAPNTVQGAPTTFTGGKIVEGGPGAAAQADALKYLQAQATGVNPVLQAQYQQAAGNQQAAMMSGLASQRGAVNPLAARTAMQSNAGAQAQLGQNAGIAQLASQRQAQQDLAGAAAQARSMSGQEAMAQGQLDQSTGQTQFLQAHEDARLNAQLGQQYQDLQARYAGMGMSAEQANQMAAIQIQKMKMDAQAANNALMGQKANALGGLLKMGGSIVGGIYGGPVGVAAGGMAGGAIGDQLGGSNSGMSGPQQSYQNPDTSVNLASDLNAFPGAGTGTANRPAYTPPGG
jgi:hypothetical protein